MHISCWKKANGCPTLNCHGQPLTLEVGRDAPEPSAKNSKTPSKPGRTPIKQARVFSSSLRKLVYISPLPLIMSAYFIFFGIRSYMKYGSLNVPGVMEYNLVFVLIPVAFAALLLLFLLSTFLTNYRKRVTITPEYVEYRQWNHSFKASWKSVSFTPPRSDRKRFRFATISDGKSFGEINAFFFPQFDLLVDVIQYAQESAKDNVEV